jgi:glycosyltransferase involved in cell wall biosynthesis
MRGGGAVASGGTNSSSDTESHAALTETMSFTLPASATEYRLRVLMLMPVDAHGRMAAVERQIHSIGRLGVDVDVVKVEGHRGLKYVETLPRFLHAARERDVVHAHYGYCGWLAGMSMRTPLVVSFMGSDLLGTPSTRGGATRASRVAANINRWFARRAAAVIVKSPEMARLLSVPAHVIPNGVDLEKFRPAPLPDARRALAWSNDRRYILFPGCPHERRKGFTLAERVVARASNTLGEPLELVALCDVDAKQVPDYMNGSDAMLMTSLWEGSPNAVKEAMACNLPVVSVPVGDVRFLLEGVQASEVVPRDEGQLADCVARTLRGGLPSTGRRALVQKQLDLESVARRILNIYTAVAATRQPAPHTSLVRGA